MNQWIEKTHLDIPVRGEPCDRGIQPAGTVVIQQKAHTHTTVRSPTKRFVQKVSRPVGLPYVVLRVDRSRGRGRKQRARRKSLPIRGKRVDSALARVR